MKKPNTRVAVVLGCLVVVAVALAAAGAPEEGSKEKVTPPVEHTLLLWEVVDGRLPDGRDMRLARARVPGGWLVRALNGQFLDGGGVTFYADPQHAWKGGSLR